MTHYFSQFNKGQELIDKLPLESFILFITAENYLNGAFFQFGRITEAQEFIKKDPRYAELATLEVHSYLSYINLTYRCFEAIVRIHNKNDENYNKDLMKFWRRNRLMKDPRSVLNPFRQARDFVEHIDERITDSKNITAYIRSGAIYLTCFSNGCLLYYPRKIVEEQDRLPGVKYVEKTNKRTGKVTYYHYEEDSIPINETELNKVTLIYSGIFDALKGHKANSQYQQENSRFTYMHNCVMNNCIGPMHALAPGSRNSTFEGCIVFPFAKPIDPTEDSKK